MPFCTKLVVPMDPESSKIPAHKDLVQLIAVANQLCGFRSSDDREKLQADVEEFVASSGNYLKLDLEQTMDILGEVWRVKSDALKTFGPGMAGETVGEIEKAEEAEKA